MGTGVHRRSAITALGVKPALGGSADEGGEDLLGVCAPPGAIAAADCEHDRAAARPVLTPPQTDFVSW